MLGAPLGWISWGKSLLDPSVEIEAYTYPCKINSPDFYWLLNPSWYQMGRKFSSVAVLCPTLCDPMNRSTPGIPIHHQLPEFTQTHAYRVSDAIQPSHPLLFLPVVPFSSWPQSLPASGSFLMSRPFTWGGQSIGVSSSASVLAVNIQDWFPSGWTGWISLQPTGLSKVFSNTTVQKHQFFWHSASFTVQHSHPYMTTGKTTALTRQTFVGKVISLLFNMLSKLVITFLPRSKHLLISWL